MARKFAAVVFSLGCVHASSVWALGLGELSLESFLNEPLKAQVDLLNTEGLHEDEVKIRLATKEDFDNIGLERAYFLTSIKFEVDMDDSGQPRILISSEDPVLEPYLDFIVEARWPSGRLLREYTVLVDPPVFDSATPVVSASQRVEEVEGIPAPKKNGSTGVSVRRSDLASGEMPDRSFNAQAGASPQPGGRYMIRRDDTLWQVAEAGRPNGVSVHQTMLDIQRLNPDAFINGNINQIKAGYIIYLPDSGDISSADLDAALEEVRQQNQDWRDGRASTPVSSSGPSLRISAQPEQAGTDAPAGATATATAAVLEDLEKSELERAELEERVSSMQQQLETLQRIVNLKDEQIAALQDELGQEAEIEPAAQTSDDALLAQDANALAAESEQEVAAADAAIAAKAPVKAAPEPKPQPKPKPKPATPPAKPVADDGGLLTKVLYGAGAVLLAGIAFVFVRRRRAEPEEELDLLADSEPDIDESDVSDSPAIAGATDQDLDEPFAQELDEDGAAIALAEAEAENRGYGEHKNDEYVSDVDDVDALAEADIYIAYGRYPQAIELLKNAIAAEPGNSAYRLKLLELHADMGDRDAALEQFGKLQAINEPASLARAEKLLASIGAAAPPAVEDTDREVGALDLISDTETPLEASFSGLEIEDLAPDAGIDEDLDLSADFSDDELDSDALEEDLVVAAESNGLSTKLDLARAYLDMGDDDGARQILDEVASEGTDDLKTEALELLERIG